LRTSGFLVTVDVQLLRPALFQQVALCSPTLFLRLLEGD